MGINADKHIYSNMNGIRDTLDVADIYRWYLWNKVNI